MRITAVTGLGKGRYQVCTEQGDAFILYRGELRRYDIREGGELSVADYTEIRDDLLYRRALNRLLYLLQKKDYTRAELSEKLRAGAYPTETAQRAISAMEGYGYVNDRSYASRYAACHAGRQSAGAIREKLRRKGIAREIIDAALEEHAAEPDQEQALICKILEKRHYDAASADAAQRHKQYGYLRGKGFRAEDIRQAFRVLDISSGLRV